MSYPRPRPLPSPVAHTTIILSTPANRTKETPTRISSPTAAKFYPHFGRISRSATKSCPRSAVKLRTTSCSRQTLPSRRQLLARNSWAITKPRSWSNTSLSCSNRELQSQLLRRLRCTICRQRRTPGCFSWSRPQTTAFRWMIKKIYMSSSTCFEWVRHDNDFTWFKHVFSLNFLRIPLVAEIILTNLGENLEEVSGRTAIRRMVQKLS